METTPTLLGTQESKGSTKIRPPMRSSIACLRCRRSKIKCNNDGGESPCETCLRSGHKCQYPEATPIPPKRKELSTGNRHDREGGGEKKRAKKTDDNPSTGNDRSAACAEEALSYPFLTDEVWDQVFSIYKLHFATELPFLHLPTLKERISRRKLAESETMPDLNLVLLGVLALTARFHPDLVKYIAHLSGPQTGTSRSRTSQSRLDPLAASEFFANILESALGPLKTAITVASIERVQAFLILSIHEWSQSRSGNGLGAWMYAGVAIRMAQALKLGREVVEADRLSRAQEASAFPGSSEASSSEDGITREVRRRTMFSCLILDRLLSCGDERNAVIRSESLRIQLPCTEMAFDLAMEVHTGFLHSSGHDRRRHVNDDSVLSRFIQLIDLWGRITQYSVAGGRTTERYAPWDERATFRKLREELDRFIAGLPETFTLSRQNYYRHDNHQATSMYVSLHMLVALCQIILHRECFPFLALRCSEPKGPLDQWSSHDCQGQERFWKDSAELLFKASRDILDLVEICRDKLPQSRLILFVIWTAGLMGIFAQHFPLMDTERHMVDQDDIVRRQEGDLDILNAASLRLVYHTLTRMASHHEGTDMYLRYLREMDEYYKRAKDDFDQQLEKSRGAEQQPGAGNSTLPAGGEGVVGPDDWVIPAPKPGKLYVEDEKPYQPAEGSDRSRASTIERGSSISASEACQSGAEYVRTPRSTPSLSFTAINNAEAGPHAPSDSLPSIREPRGGDVPRREHRHPSSITSTPSASLLVQPSHHSRSPLAAAPEFSLERLSLLESRRIAAVLNDLQAFSGAGCFGENAWDDLGEAWLESKARG